MKVWILRAVLFSMAVGIGYWTGFTLSFFADVLPHGGAW